MFVKHLNFFPYYEDLLKNGLKTTTIRLGINSRFQVNDQIIITVGWSEDSSLPVRGAVVTEVFNKQINQLSITDLEGESPDCSLKSSVKYVLSAIYRKKVEEDDYVTIIKWNYLK